MPECVPVRLLTELCVSYAGVYNEQAFAAMDHILNEASKYGIRLILTLADNWSPVDSKSQVRQTQHYLIRAPRSDHSQSGPAGLPGLPNLSDHQPAPSAPGHVGQPQTRPGCSCWPTVSQMPPLCLHSAGGLHQSAEPVYVAW